MMNAIGRRAGSLIVDRGVVRATFSADVSGGPLFIAGSAHDFGADTLPYARGLRLWRPRVTICALLRGSQFRLDLE